MVGKQARNSARVSVPSASREVTAAWLQAALRRAFPSMAIKSFQMQRIGEGYGLASRLFRCRLIGSGCPESVVVKLWHTEGAAGAREVFFYRTFGNEVGGRIAACFFAAVDDERQRGVLVLEDINPLIQGDCLQQLAAEPAQALARQLAGIHAQWLGSDVLREADWLPSLLPWKKNEGWFAQRRELFLDRFGKRLNDRARALLEQVEQAPEVTNARLAESPHTLLHVDFHLDNIVFDSQMEAVILDWARCAKGPLAFDLYSLLFDISRREDSEDVLGAYVSAIAETDGKAPAVDGIQRQLAGVFLYDFALRTCGVARWRPSSAREEVMIETGIERALRALDYWYSSDTELFSFLA